MSVIESLKWRSAIKKFDTTKKVGKEELEKLLEAGNLAATSGGLQPFKIVVVSNDEMKSRLVPLSYGQTQVADASHVLVFAIETEIGEGTVDAYIERAAEVRNQDIETLRSYRDSMNGYVSSMNNTAKYAWAKNQAYIALGTVLAAAADLRIDSCPMEGLDAYGYQEILDLGSINLMPVVILPIGYRSEEDAHSKESKVRKTRENFIVELN